MYWRPSSVAINMTMCTALYKVWYAGCRGPGAGGLVNLEGHNLTLIPNETEGRMNNFKMQLQPEHDENTLCTDHKEGHSEIKPCGNVGGLSLKADS